MLKRFVRPRKISIIYHESWRFLIPSLQHVAVLSISAQIRFIAVGPASDQSLHVISSTNEHLADGYRDVFSAGASHYGVADLELLAQETHKFESRYLDGLVGPWPQTAAVYKERSPIEALDKFDKPVAFFQVGTCLPGSGPGRWPPGCGPEATWGTGQVASLQLAACSVLQLYVA